MDNSSIKAGFILVFLFAFTASEAQWIRRDSTVWGVRNGIVAGLWPGAIESLKEGANGGPRGLLRIGYHYGGVTYHINYIAVEPVVNGKIEFSEISPSASDGKWGKLMWIGDTVTTAETLSLFVYMEKFRSAIHPNL